MRREGGFTLLEVMIAMTIMAVAIVATLELFGGSLRLAGASARQGEALVLARSLIDESLWRADVVEDSQAGSEGPYSWVLESHPIDRGLIGLDEDLPAVGDSHEDYILMEISATVSWGGIGGEHHVTLATARVTENNN